MTDSISTRVVLAVADKTGGDPTDLPPLYEAINPDSLDALFEPSREGDGPDRRSCEVRFSYAGREVRVRNGEVTVGQPSSQSTSAMHD